MAYWGNQRWALTLIRPMSSYTRQLVPLYQTQYQAKIGTLFYSVSLIFHNFCHFLAALLTLKFRNYLEN